MRKFDTIATLTQLLLVVFFVIASDIRYHEGMKKVILIVVAGLLWSNTVFSIVSLTEEQI
jgi:hypothetical protein